MSSTASTHTPSPRNFKKIFQNLMIFFNLGLTAGKTFGVTIFSLIITALVTLTIPIAFRYLIDKGLKNAIDLELIVLFIGLVLTLAIGTALRYYSVTITGERVYNHLRAKVFRHLLTFSQYEFQHLKISDVLSRLMSDAEAIRDFVGSSLSIVGRNFLLLVGGLAMMLHTDWKLTSMILMIIPIIFVPVIMLGKSLKHLSKEAQIKLAESNNVLSETLYALSTVQNFNQENYQYEKFSDLVHCNYMISKNRILRRGILTFCIITLIFSAVLLILLYGSYTVNNGTITAGELTQFVLYSVFTAGASASLSEALGSVQKIKIAYDRLEEILNITPKIQNPDNPLALEKFQTIHFDNVSFCYENRTVPALSDINMQIKAQQKIALVGLSGSGKTSFLKLLLREINATSGNLLWNGHEINAYNIADIRQQITYVSQNITLFSGTIADNIRFGHSKATIRDIIRASSDANLHHDIMKLPQGYDTYIGERGTALSGGQQQRLAIARGLLKNAPIWILDEPTSALDSETENKLLKTLFDLTIDKTIITVTHRLSSLSQMDMIYVLENGKIIEQGTHKTLWDNSNSRYREFINYQLNQF